MNRSTLQDEFNITHISNFIPKSIRKNKNHVIYIFIIIILIKMQNSYNSHVILEF